MMRNDQEEVVLINDMIASLGYRMCSWFENKYRDRAARWWSYPLVILTKKPDELCGSGAPIGPG